MKKCPRCNITKVTTEFARSTKATDGLQTYCRACHKKMDREHYKRSADRRKKIRSSNAAMRQERIDWLIEYKRQAGCTDCGETDPVVLDFDHLGDKVENLANMANGWPWEKILTEVQKCEVVCSNDHRRRTHARRQAGDASVEGHHLRKVA